MEISILQNIDGAKQAKGLTVIIDVFRAFSTACYVFGNGAEKIIPVGDIQIAYRLKKENPDFVLMGERHGVIQPGFDFGNSPWQVSNVSFRNKTVVLTTTAGTQGIVNAKGAGEIITGSFVNIDAIVKYIKFKNPEIVSLVCTGSANEQIMDEDAYCAQFIKNELLQKPNDFKKITEHLKEAGFAKHFFDPKRQSHPLEDFELCMVLNRFNFVLKTQDYKKNLVCLKKLDQ